MSSLKLHEGFSNVSFDSKIIASAAVDAFLKGEDFLPLSKFRDEGIPEIRIQESLQEFHERGIIKLPGKVLEGTIDSSRISQLIFGSLTLNVGFGGNGQPSMFDKAKEKPEFGEGRHDHRIGHAVYRCTVTAGIIEEGEPMDYLVNIDRYTIPASHLRRKQL